MDKMKIDAIDVLDRVIIGRVDPHIYAFTTNTVPNYLKIGDTYRPVSQRLKEWRVFFPNLVKQYENKAIIDEKTYFRDYAIHQYLENDLNKKRLKPEELDEGVYYSREFFKEAKAGDIDNAIEDIRENYQANSSKYEYYSSKNRLPQTFHYQRGEQWTLRPNQQAAVDSFTRAVENGRRNLLMYAVMRFGKSFTSLCCALEISANIVLVVSAKADVKDEWKKTVEGAGNFSEYEFLDSYDLSSSEDAIKLKLKENKKVVIFLTLQDLQGETIKDKHKELLKGQVDLLIIDETHFGARAKSFGKILEHKGYEKSDKSNIDKLDDENIDLNIAEEELKQINSKIRLHLSGTPYRILMGSEFEKEDIISFVQFSDIVKEQEEWDKNNLNKDYINEWDNPYYGFPQMVRFAFNPNKSSREKIETLKRSGVTFAFSKLFEPESIKKDTVNNGHKKFINEIEILDLLQVIDGSKEDENLLGFLDYDKIKEGKMCRHMVMVLPYCASCDAMEALLSKQKGSFKNLGEYEIINISGVDAGKMYKRPNDIKNKIKACEDSNKKTITLTVNRMLTGSTVEQWDTMLYFKDTSSPQEYDQSIFRLQNQYVRTLSSEKGIIKENLKPQTLLVDFDPDRMFRMQEQKSLIYNVNTEDNGNSKLKERIIEELRISPIIMMNHNKIKKVNATNILEVISEYNNQRSVSDEVFDIPVDLSILNDESIRKVIVQQAEFNSKQGLIINPNQDEGDMLDFGGTGDEANNPEGNQRKPEHKDYDKEKNDKEIEKLEGQIKTYYQRLLFFSFLTKNQVASLDDILSVIDKDENIRLSKNLFLDKCIIEKISKVMDPFKRSRLDYKIQNISMLACDESVAPIIRAMTAIKKFNRMSESEVITPSKVCDEMVGLVPDEVLNEIVSKKDKFIDIASKAGEYAVSLYNRLTSELGYLHEDVKDIIYSIPTSSIAYEFTRRFYEILGLNVENIAVYFSANDLINVRSENDEVDYEKISSILNQKKDFSKITLEDEIKAGEKTVKFGAVIGNPPYQASAQGTSSSDDPIYHMFVEISHNIGDISILITPARFLFDAGKTPSDWNKKMLDDPHLKVPFFESDSAKVFKDILIPGGVAITYRDSRVEFGKIGKFFSYPELKVIKDKVWKENQDSIRNIIYSQNKFNLDALYNDYPEYKSIIGSNGKDRRFRQIIMERLGVFTEEKIETNSIRVLGLIKRVRTYRYIPKKYVENEIWIDKYKVFVPFSNGASGTLGDEPARMISKPVLGMQDDGITQTFIGIGAFDNQFEAESLLKYIKTKFCRILLAILKVTQGNKSETWEYVPIQDFSKTSDIDWNKSIEEIDKQLYRKYDLTKEDIAFINKRIADI